MMRERFSCFSAASLLVAARLVQVSARSLVLVVVERVAIGIVLVVESVAIAIIEVVALRLSVVVGVGVAVAAVLVSRVVVAFRICSSVGDVWIVAAVRLRHFFDENLRRQESVKVLVSASKFEPEIMKLHASLTF